MFYSNTLNLIQVGGGTQVKQGDLGSKFSYKLANEKDQELDDFDKEVAHINLVLDDKIVFTTTATVDNSTVTFNIDKAIPIGLYFLEIKIRDYIFPSDKQTIIFVQSGAVAYDLQELVPNYDVNMTLKGILSDLSQKGIDISDLNRQLAQKANKDEVTNVITPKGTLAYASLPTSGNQVGWYYYCPDGDGTHGAGNYVWNGTSWFFGGTGDEGYNLLKKDIDEYHERLYNTKLITKQLSDFDFYANGWIEGKGNINTSGSHLHKVVTFKKAGIKKIYANYAEYPANTINVITIKDYNENVVYHKKIETSSKEYTFDISNLDDDCTVYFNYFNYNDDTYTHVLTFEYTVPNVISNAISNEIAKLKTGVIYRSLVRKPFNFNGKTCVFTGDSITYGFTSGSSNVHNKGDYPTLFCNKVGATKTNLALGGALFSSGYNTVKTIPKQVSEANKECDFLFIAGGINDWQNGQTLSGLETVLDNLCTYINENFSQSTQVIWITPINHAGWETTHNISPTATVQEFRNLITRTVLKNDIYSRFSIVQGNEFNFPNKEDDSAYIKAMFGDLLHPSELGYKTLYLTGLLNALC